MMLLSLQSQVNDSQLTNDEIAVIAQERWDTNVTSSNRGRELFLRNNSREDTGEVRYSDGKDIKSVSMSNKKRNANSKVAPSKA